MKISKYGTFGIHQEWVDQYLTDTDSFWEDNFLGVKQVPSFKAWLKDAEIIDEKLMDAINNLDKTVGSTTVEKGNKQREHNSFVGTYSYQFGL